MTQEEKAKAYDEALERARAINSGKDIDVEAGTTTCEYIFPELKESEDEKIRKELIEHIKANKWADYVLFQKFSPDDILAWLEKQESVEEIVARCKDSWYNEGKIAGMAEGLSDDEKYQQGWHDALEKQGEKPQGKTALEAVKEEKVDNANKVEPKFKVGDWITDGYLHCKISDVLDDRYIVDTKFTKRSAIPFKRENEYHLWTTADAKDGDILIASDESIFIYAGSTDRHAKFYAALTKNGRINVEGGIWEDKNRVHPATKEQHDALMKAMADAGYEWDANKKELKKSEQKLTKFEDAVKDMMNDYRDAIGDNNVTIEEVKKHSAYLQSLISQNPAWSNGYSNGYIQAVEKAVEWLKNHNDYIDVKDGNVTYFDMGKCVEDFRKAMKGGEE